MQKFTIEVSNKGLSILDILVDETTFSSREEIVEFIVNLTLSHMQADLDKARQEAEGK